PSRAKSAERMDGAMTGACMGISVAMVQGGGWRVCPCRPRPAPDRRSAAPLLADAVVGGVDLARLLLRLLAQLRRGAGNLVGVVLRHQPAVGLVDFLVAGLARQAQRPVRRGTAAAAGDPARIEGVADDQPDQAAGRMPQQQPPGDEAQHLSVPTVHAGQCSARAFNAGENPTTLAGPPAGYPPWRPRCCPPTSPG